MMDNGRVDSLALDDEDHLPWLEPVYQDDGGGKASPLRILLFILAGLVLIGLVVGGIHFLRNRGGNTGGAELIQAPSGDYKIRAADADARKFEGEGDASFAASEGIDRGGRIDPSRLPEAPIMTGAADKSAAGDKSAAAAKKVETAVADRTGEKAAAAAPASAPATAGGMVQLGAYGSEALAQGAWKRFSKRFTYLANLPYNVQEVTVGGAKFYRLRAVAGKDAGTLCGKLKVAGESCIVVR